MARIPTLIAAFVLAPGIALADGPVVYPYDGAFDDAAFALESAILDRGLNIDYVSHIGEMLARTKEDVGGTRDIFVAAQSFLFCSASLSRKMMEADPLNIAQCPYSVFVFETGDGVFVGHRDMPEGPMKEVEALLDEIAREAVGD